MNTLLGSSAAAPQGEARTAARAPAHRSAPALRPAPKAADLMGGDEALIRASLGAPDFVRKEQGAEIWRYGGETCTLLVFFYEEEQGLRTAHIDARAREGGAADRENCIASVNKALQRGARSA